MSAQRLDLKVAAEAESALEQIRQAAGKEVPDEVFSRLAGLPVMLRTNGVPATLAYFAAKSTDSKTGEAYRAVATALHKQLAETLGVPATPTALYATLRTTDNADLLRAFARLEAYAGWLRRLAEALEHEQDRERKRRASQEKTTVVTTDG